MVALPRLALRGALPAHDFEFAADTGDTVLHTAPVRRFSKVDLPALV